MTDATPGTTEVEAVRRTSLALERTQLAWWRTGLTSLAVGIGVGRVIPVLEGGSAGPYAIAGVGFAIYGVALFAYGSMRERTLASQLARGESDLGTESIGMALGAAGTVLGLATALLIIFS